MPHGLFLERVGKEYTPRAHAENYAHERTQARTHAHAHAHAHTRTTHWKWGWGHCGRIFFKNTKAKHPNSDDSIGLIMMDSVKILLDSAKILLDSDGIWIL